ncbi:MAG: hypothetical protein RJA99_1153 [Pseudomonadota bacterium]|jgi:thiol-disulfide isomerase/thioredoxin
MPRPLPPPRLPEHATPPGERRHWLLRIGALTVAGLALRPMLADALPSGSPVPELALRTDAGDSSLAARRGRVVWLDFWASWCAPCRRSFPWMQAMHARYAAHGLDVVALNLDARPEPARRFLAEHPVGFTVAYDASGESARRFGVRTMPTAVLIGGDGRVVSVHAGFRDEDREVLEATLRRALHERGALPGSA